MTDFKTELQDAANELGLGEALIQRSDRPDLSDFQCNVAFAGARILRQAPLAVATLLAEKITDPEVDVSVAGGFLNFTLKNTAIPARLKALVSPARRNEAILFDYGGPNIAKPMHVGHLRSLVIGDALKGIAGYLGYDVTSDIHLGDWGYQMGLLLAYSKAETLDDLERDYVAASAKAKDDPEFKKQAQQMTLALQAGDPDTVGRWKKFVDLSMRSIMQDIWHGLGTNFTWWLGESASECMMDEMLEKLAPYSRLHDGALVAGDFDPPLILKNSEGGFLYAATDLATLLLRKHLNPPPARIIYVVDERQALHFKQVIDLAGHLTDAKLEHVGFGTVNDANGKPFKTREGGVPRLSMLINEAIAKMEERIDDKETARWVAIAAIKFADLQTKRTSSYSFDLDRSLGTEGRTGVYMLYQNVRIKSICAKASVSPGKIEITSDSQRQLALEVTAFEDVVQSAWDARMPHLLVDHLYTLCQRFSAFYAAEDIGGSSSNLALSLLVQERLDAGLRMLGIQPVEAM